MNTTNINSTAFNAKFRISGKGTLIDKTVYKELEKRAQNIGDKNDLVLIKLGEPTFPKSARPTRKILGIFANNEKIELCNIAQRYIFENDSIETFRNPVGPIKRFMRYLEQKYQA